MAAPRRGLSSEMSSIILSVGISIFAFVFF